MTETVVERELSAEQALELLEAAVATRGADYNYKLDEKRFPSNPEVETFPACRYTRNGEPDCLVGVVLAAEGVPLEVLTYIDDWGLESAHTHDGDCPEDCAEANIGGPWAQDVIRQRSGLVLSDEAAWALASAQIYQDTGRTWGEALAAAKRAIQEGKEQNPHREL